MRVGQLAAAALELGRRRTRRPRRAPSPRARCPRARSAGGAREVSSCWSAWRSLAVPVPGVEPGLVAGGAVAHQLRRRPRPWRPRAARRRARCASATSWSSRAAALPLEVGELGELGQVRARVRDLVEARVDGLEVEQPQLAGRARRSRRTSGVGTDDEGPGVGAHCADVGLHPSCPRSPSAATQPALGAGQPDQLAGPVPDVDEVGRAAAGASSRASRAGWWRRSAVT